jgi:hypothetical protein
MECEVVTEWTGTRPQGTTRPISDTNGMGNGRLEPRRSVSEQEDSRHEWLGGCVGERVSDAMDTTRVYVILDR